MNEAAANPRHDAGMMNAPTKKELLGLRLQATCRGNERLRTLMMCLGLTVGGMFDELMEQGWSDAEATQSIVDALTEVQQGLMSELVHE